LWRFQSAGSPPGIFRAKLLQELKHAYTGTKKRSVKVPALRLPSKRGVEGTNLLPTTLSTVEAFRAISSKGLMEF
jgi:hypothetical protein